MTWETMAISLYLVEEYDAEHKFHSTHKQHKADMIAWYSLQSTALAPCNHYYLAHREAPYMQQARPFLRSEVLRLLSVLDSHLANSSSGYISPHGYSYADMGWAPYSDHYIQTGLGYELEDFPNIKKWHDRIYARPAVARAYAKLGIKREREG